MRKEYLLDTAQMQQLDRNTIEKTGLSGDILMERAAERSALLIQKYLVKNHKRSILVVAGNGNNAGDAIATGRILCEYGFPVTIFLITDLLHHNDNVKQQLSILSHYPVSVTSKFPEKSFDVIIDGIFGIGLNRLVTGKYQKAIEKINQCKSYVVALDIASGIQAGTGEIMGCAVCADMTITYGFLKRGHFFGAGKEHCGKLRLVKMGINETSFYGTKPEMFTYYVNRSKEKHKKIDLLRKRSGHKGTFGKVMIIAGSTQLNGSAVLCAKAALKSGCGMVHLVSEALDGEVLLKELPEAMFTRITKETVIETVKRIGEWADVIAIGPSIGFGETARAALETVLTMNKPLVIDADAITLFARDIRLQELCRKRSKGSQNEVVFTPHIKELSALSGVCVEEVIKNPFKTAQKAADEYSCIIAAKNASTLVCSAEGGEVYYNLSGCDAMATAGSGDVLTGLCASMIAGYCKKKEIPYEQGTQEKAVFYAVCMAVFLHGLSGEAAAHKTSNSYVTANNIISGFKDVMK